MKSPLLHVFCDQLCLSRRLNVDLMLQLHVYSMFLLIIYSLQLGLMQSTV